MTEKQRRYFFRALWPECCAVKGWQGTDAERHAVTLEATTELALAVPGGPKPTGSMSACTQDQLTAVFNLVKWYADPDNLDKARPVANPAEAKAQDECKRLVWKIREAANRDKVTLNDAYISRSRRGIARGPGVGVGNPPCRVAPARAHPHQQSREQERPRRASARANRANRPMPTEDEQTVYVMSPRRSSPRTPSRSPRPSKSKPRLIMSEENDKNLNKPRSFCLPPRQRARRIFYPARPHAEAHSRPSLDRDLVLGEPLLATTDEVERCDMCGDLYHTSQEGHCLDYGKAPYFFCDCCRRAMNFAGRKVAAQPQ